MTSYRCTERALKEDDAPLLWSLSLRMNIPVNTVVEGDLWHHCHHGNYFLLFYRLHLSPLYFVEIRWTREAVVSASSKFDLISTNSPFVVSGDVRISSTTADTVTLKSALNSPWSIECLCLWVYLCSWLEISQISVLSGVEGWSESCVLVTFFVKIWEILSHEHKHSQRQKHSMLQGLFKALFGVTVPAVVEEILKPPLTTKGELVEIRSNLELAETTASRVQRISTNHKGERCSP